MTRRKNPYPLYTDCDDALSELQRFMEEVMIPREMEALGFHNTKFLTDVPFVHNLQLNEGEDPYDLLQGPQSLLGKVTPERLLLSNIVDAYARGNGYLFAYDHADEGRVASSARYYLEGMASHAVRFFHHGDSEDQLIIPIKCITSMEIRDRGPSAQLNFDPYFEQGISVSDRTGVRPRHLMGGIIGEVQPLCPVCQTYFSDVDMTSPEQLAAYPKAWGRIDNFGTAVRDSDILMCGKCKGDPEWRDPTPEKECVLVTPGNVYPLAFRYYEDIARQLSPEFWEEGLNIKIERSREDRNLGYVYDEGSLFSDSRVNNNPRLPHYIRELNIHGPVLIGDYEELLWTPTSREGF